MQTSYNKGSNWERRIIKEFTKIGYLCLRSAGSHTPIDLVAMNEENTILIQAKSTEVDTIPNIKELLKATQKTSERQKYYKEHGLSIPLPKGEKEVESNVRLLEQFKCCGSCMFKMILWKGMGRNNFYALEWREDKQQWVGRTFKSFEEII